MPASRKEVALSFLRLAASGKVREAYQKHVAPNFKHHNPYFRGDAESLMIGMEENAAKNPTKVLEVQRVRMKPDEPGLAVVHIFKFQGDRIIELWDLGQPVPQNSPNENGMF